MGSFRASQQSHGIPSDPAPIVDYGQRFPAHFHEEEGGKKRRKEEEERGKGREEREEGGGASPTPQRDSL